MEDKKPFNDAVDHMKNIEGLPAETDLRKLPKPLRYFGYFMFGFFGIAMILMMIGSVFLQ